MSKKYPVLPIRNDVLFPGALIPVEVGRERSQRVIDKAIDNDNDIVIVSQRRENIDRPGKDDLFEVGCLAEIQKSVNRGNNRSLYIKGLKRMRVEEWTQSSPHFEAKCSEISDTDIDAPEIQTLSQNLHRELETITQEIPNLPSDPGEVLSGLLSEDPGTLSDFVPANLPMGVDKAQQEFLEERNVKKRLEKSLEALQDRLARSQHEQEIEEEVTEELNDKRRKRAIKQRINELQSKLDDLGEGDGPSSLSERVDKMDLPERVEEACREQIDRLESMQESSSEYSIALNYVELLLDLPWNIKSQDNLNLDQAQETLEMDHYGLEDVKERIMEHLAVQALKEDRELVGEESPILCLVGPPGVGKTSLGKSVARTMGRKFRRISLGGIYDESEIRGHRRTYVGALPGKIIRALKKTGTMNPVILLDEIDKIGNDFRGDPEAALLEVLDPEQNSEFEDHYVELPVDLSDVFFITTANTLDSISDPLRDRMEVIEVPSYTNFEKERIAEEHLSPKQRRSHGLREEDVDLTDDALDILIENYTREAGVRELERKIGEVYRKAAIQLAGEEDKDAFHQTIDDDWVVDQLGPKKHRSKVAERTSTPGVATGLAWTQHGGDILFVETQIMEGSGELKLTGQLGDVMQESVQAALSYIKSRHDQFNLPADFNSEIDLHTHFPKGAVPKDGPSAGITTFTSILSALTDVPVREEVAMTGEITLRGRVLEVGGIKEKVTAAHRAGIEEIILPEACEDDLEEVNESVREDLEFHLVNRVDEVPKLALENELPEKEDIVRNPMILSELDESSAEA